MGSLGDAVGVCVIRVAEEEDNLCGLFGIFSF